MVYYVREVVVFSHYHSNYNFPINSFQLENEFDSFTHILNHIASRVLRMIFQALEYTRAHKYRMPSIARFIIGSLNVRLGCVTDHVEV